ncbi:MAG: energy-coupling factor ABC transporter ATP-binding protein [Victivallaceae bacterium]
MSHHIIEVKNLDYVYPGGKQALKDVSFRVTHGESVGIIGVNGAGKSTLLMHLNGVLFPSGGEVSVGEIAVRKNTLPLIRQHVGFIFQNPDDQLFMSTVYDDVAFGPRNFKLPEEEVEKKVLSALETVGITHLRNRPPYRLSEGEKRSAAIASVLSMSPDILVMDEPSSSLDPSSRRRLIKLLHSFKHTRIIASHDLDMILEICERTIVIKDGEIMADAPTLEIFADAALLERCGLEKPFCMQKCPVCAARKSPAALPENC